MIPIRNGSWMILNVAVNSEDISSRDDFRQLVVDDNQVRIEPAGISFSVSQSTSKSAVLESRSQVFFADFFEKDEQLRLTLSRPTFSETVSMEALFENANSFA